MATNLPLPGDSAREATDQAQEHLLVRAHLSGRPLKWWQPVSESVASNSDVLPILAGKYLFHIKSHGEIIDLTTGRAMALNIPWDVEHVAMSNETFAYWYNDIIYWTSLDELDWHERALPPLAGNPFNMTIHCIAVSGKMVAIARSTGQGIQVDIINGHSYFRARKTKPDSIVRLALDPCRLFIASAVPEPRAYLHAPDTTKHTFEIINFEGQDQSLIDYQIGRPYNRQGHAHGIRVIQTDEDTLYAIDHIGGGISHVLTSDLKVTWPIKTNAIVWKGRLYETHFLPPEERTASSVITCRRWDGYPGDILGHIFAPSTEEHMNNAGLLLANDTFLIDYHGINVWSGQNHMFTAYTFDPSMPGKFLSNGKGERSSIAVWSGADATRDAHLAELVHKAYMERHNNSVRQLLS